MASSTTGSWFRGVLAAGALVSAIVPTSGCETDDRQASKVVRIEQPQVSPEDETGQLVRSATRRCQLGRCEITGCVDQLDELDQLASREARAFDALILLVGDRDPKTSLVALYFANGLLTRWHQDRTLGDKVSREQRDALVTAGRATPCSGPLFTPLVLPGGALADPTVWPAD